jgi:oxygen-independent coproporphyrinogen-3 oxidase
VAPHAGRLQDRYPLRPCYPPVFGAKFNGIVAFALYVHIPYCQAKCPYCDFNSYAAPGWPEDQYVAALCGELRHYAQGVPWSGNKVATVFFGGGTPSLFAPDSIEGILAGIFDLWQVEQGSPLEVTLEANPGTVTLEKLRAFRAAGVNRLSFGVQSFQPHHLRRLGRIHDVETAVASVALARRAGFENVGIDLIFALPEQTLQEWHSDLARACELHPDHVSAYNLTYEEGTPFHKLHAQGVLRQLPEDTEVAMLTRTQEVLAAAGYEQYEISNYSTPAYRCRHNLTYWRSGDYLGVGAGAHSYARNPGAIEDGSFGARWSNEKNPTRYIDAVERQGQARVFIEDIDAHRARGEFVFLGLRCLEGFSAVDFRERFGADLPALFPHVSDLCDGGLLQHKNGRWKLTPQGLLLADSVFGTFL